MTYLKIATVLVIAALVVAGHVGLWLSPDWPTDLKWRLTVLNALGWGIVILPAVGVAFWARSHRKPRGGGE